MFTNQAVYMHILFQHCLEGTQAVCTMGRFTFTPKPQNRYHRTIMYQEQLMLFGFGILVLEMT